MKYISKDRSFQTGEISNFNELFGISLILPENHYYKLELCKDVNKRSRQLDKEYEFPIKPVKTRRLGCSKMFYQKPKEP